MNNYNHVMHQFFQLSRAMTKDLNKRLAPLQLTHAQLTVIDYLLHKDNSSLVDIAKYLNVEKSSVTRVVNHLEKNDFVERANSVDNRERRIQMSDVGMQQQKMIQQTKDDFEAQTFHNISQQELDITVQTLLKMLNNINGVDPVTHE